MAIITRITGSLGSGKTTVLNVLAKSLMDNGFHILRASGDSTIAGILQSLSVASTNALFVDDCTEKLANQLAKLPDSLRVYVAMQSSVKDDCLDQELATGKAAAESVAHHVHEMGASSATIPVTSDGVEFNVVVYRKEDISVATLGTPLASS